MAVGSFSLVRCGILTFTEVAPFVNHFCVISAITFGLEVGSGVSVGILVFVGGEEDVAVAVHRIWLRVARADTVVATTRSISKKHFS
jgi:hypothetical protein